MTLGKKACGDVYTEVGTPSSSLKKGKDCKLSRGKKSNHCSKALKPRSRKWGLMILEVQRKKVFATVPIRGGGYVGGGRKKDSLDKRKCWLARVSRNVKRKGGRLKRSSFR